MTRLEMLLGLMQRFKVKHAKFECEGVFYDMELDASAFGEVTPAEIVPEKPLTKEETIKATHRDLFWSGAYDPDEKIEV